MLMVAVYPVWASPLFTPTLMHRYARPKVGVQRRRYFFPVRRAPRHAFDMGASTMNRLRRQQHPQRCANLGDGVVSRFRIRRSACTRASPVAATST